MTLLPGVRRAWNLLLRRRDVIKAVDEELDFHLERTTQELITSGLDPVSARAEAERRFGDRRAYHQDCLTIGERRRRNQRRRRSRFDLVQDLRFAFRIFRRTPALTLTEIGTLALGIGGVTAMFSLVSHVLLNPLPYREPDRILALEYFNENSSYANVSEAEFWDFRSESETLSGVAIIDYVTVLLAGPDRPDLIRGVRATGDLFPLLGVVPRLGRFFTPQDALPGAPDVVVISHRLWRDRFGGEKDIIGRPIRVEGFSPTVVGVMPPGFFFPAPGRDFWIPLHLDPAAPEPRNNHRYRGFARLADSVRLDEARAEIRSQGDRMVAAWPQYYRGFQPWFDLRPISDQLVGDTRLPLLILLGAVVFILLIAGSNVAGLQLARGELRRREIAIRGALGAGRGRVVRLILIENLLLALIGGLAGIAVARLGIDSLVAGLGSSLPRIEEVRLDTGMLFFTLAVTLGVGLLFGLLPARQGARRDPSSCLQERGRSLTMGRRRLATRQVLVAAEVALACALSIGAGVMLRSLSVIHGLDLGFQVRDRFSLQVNLPVDEFPEEDSVRRARFYQELVDEVARLPDVHEAAVGECLPLVDRMGNLSIQIAGREVETIGEAPIAEIQEITPGWFEAMGIPLVRGRVFTRDDRADTRPVAMVNRTMARLFWPGEDPIGKQVRLYGEEEWMEIVGVAGDLRHNGVLDPIRQRLYVPISQAPFTSYSVTDTARLVLHGTGETSEWTATVRGLAASLNGGVLVTEARRMEAVVSDAMMLWRVPTHLLGLFGVVALLLAAIGTYGLVAHAVGQRTREIGIRIALGADQARILRETSRYGIGPAAIGILIGLLISLAASRLLIGMLYGVGPTDPPTFLIVLAVLATTTAAAALLPAMRILRIDPASALREE